MWRRLLAELMGTALLVTVVVGSGIAAARLSPSCWTPAAGKQHGDSIRAGGTDLGVWAGIWWPLFIGLAVDWMLTRRPGNGLSPALSPCTQRRSLVGAILGALLANIMFAYPRFRSRARTG